MSKPRFYIPDQILVYGLILAVIIYSFYFASKYIKPAPPSTITIAAGAKGGAYMAYAQEYKKLLEAERMEVTILKTKGSVENLDLLYDGKADVAFVQGGTNNENDKRLERIEALASVYYEPLWFFVKADSEKFNLRDFKGKRIAIGVEGSGTKKLVEKLLKLNGIDDSNTTLLPLSAKPALNAIANNKADAMFAVAGFEASTIQALLRSDKVRLVSLGRAEAYARRFPFFSRLVLPEGILDFENNIPDADKNLLSASAMLVANKDLHPALKKLVVHTSAKVHNKRGVFSDKHFFPTLSLVDLPISKEAEHYFEFGASLLQRYVPFWLADLLDRLKVMLIPLLAIFLPLAKIASPAYRWRVRSKIYKLYKRLEKAEDDIETVSGDKQKQEILKMLAEMEEMAKDTPVPLSYRDSLYNLRLHINLVTQELAGKKIEKPKNKASK